LAQPFFLLSCNNDKQHSRRQHNIQRPALLLQTPADLPYKPSYSSSWSNDVSDADLKMVLTTYKDWADNNMANLSNSMADTVKFDFASGEHFKKLQSRTDEMWTYYIVTA
jgi:hypothetical protein